MTARRTLCCLVAALALAGAAVPAAAASDTDTATASTATAKKHAKKKTEKQPSHKIKFIKSPSEESHAERAQRLKRECKGRPNAGACLGYAS